MDIKAELNNFRSIDLDSIIQKGENISDNVRNSVFLYNKAIDSLRNGSEDIAIIELKKAVSMNPNFNEALNLLGICYSFTGDKEKAADAFAKVVSSEPNSVYAMNFMQRSGIGEAIPTALKSKQQKKPALEQPGEPLKRIRDKKPEKPEKPEKSVSSFIIDNNKNKRMIANVVKIGAGFVAGFVLSAAIFMSLPKQEAVIQPLQEENIDTAISQANAELETKYAELESKYQVLLQDKEEAARQVDYYKGAFRLFEVESLVGSKEYESAADMLMLMKSIDFEDAEKDKFDSLYTKVMPLAAKSAYDKGYKLYNQKKYQEALENLEKVRMYDAKNSKMSAALYYMGRCNQVLKDPRSALALFQELADGGYPESWYTRNARLRISELTKAQ